MNQLRFLLLIGIITIGSAYSHASEPCCSVTSFDRATGLVRAVHDKTKQQFEFRVDAAEPASIAAGARFEADLAAKRASIGGKSYTISKVHQNPGAPCCAVKSIDAKNLRLQVYDTVRGRTMQLKVTDRATLRTLKVGHPLYAGASPDVFSVDGATPCCALIP